MTPTETVTILRQFNEWRMGDYEPSEQPEPPNPYEVSLAIDAAVEMIDRLETAESDGLEQARLLGMSGEREAALLSKLEAAEKAVTEAYQRGYKTGQEEIEKERDALRAKVEAAENENAKLHIALAEKVTSEATLRDLSVGNGFINATFEEGAVQPILDALADQFVESGASNYIEMQLHSKAALSLLLTLQRVDGKTPHQLRAEAEKERDELRAKIERMEKQEPVAWLHESRCDSDVVTNAVKHVWGKAAVGSMAAYSIPLYTLPGAKGE